MILPILLWPDDALKQVCAPVRDFDDSLESFASDLVETMVAANGVGLAASQVGVLKRVFAMMDGAKPVVLINAEFHPRIHDGKVSGEEGCLSVPGKFLQVMRWKTGVVRYQTIDGKARRMTVKNLAARVVQHELDHGLGVMFMERAK